MRRISYILLLGILFIGMPKRTQSPRHELTCRGYLSNKKRQRPTEVVNTPFYQGPIMRQSYLSASMAPSWISTYGPDKRSPKAVRSSRSITVTSWFASSKQRRSTRKPTKSINGSRPFTKRITSPEVIMRRRKADFLVAKIQLRDRRQRPKRYPIWAPLTTGISKISISNLSKTWKRPSQSLPS